MASDHSNLTDKQRAYLASMVETLGASQPDRGQQPRRAVVNEDPRERSLAERSFEQSMEARADRKRQELSRDTGLYDENGEVKCNYPHTRRLTAAESGTFLKRNGWFL